jgi:serine/threonine protein kinase
MSLAYLHDKKILHRDLKPQNVFLSKRYKMIKVKAVRWQRRLPRRRPDSTGHRIRTLAEGVGRLRKD